ncbi:hypothetical protein C9374_013777 [Naegleria lovaniensis]|uniref:Uncharacterized protein n=1 Tax=Naegleria lovaniensis TaxID=51637 RepID=A0AA88G561_NAELO|nr:uncharacterized protein C9374_013777 [Naegleria lovaniensis]KAG2370866.1 hypothetical protein C9374_013777 [Naegleria lovaniensis]
MANNTTAETNYVELDDLKSTLLNDDAAADPRTDYYVSQDKTIHTTLSEVATKKQKKRKLRIILSVCLLSCCCIALWGVIILFLIGWFSIGDYLWHVAFGIDPEHCDLFRESTIANFTILHDCPPLTEPQSQWKDKLSRYWVPLNKTEAVKFNSRDADWLPNFGQTEIVGTLLKQDFINSTSKFVIVVHGYRVCRFRYESMLPAGILYHLGYNVLQIDLRNHGDSPVFKKVPYVSFGSFEHLDVLGGVDFLTQRYPFLATTNNIGVFGTSMGAATSVVAFARETNLKVAFVDSPPCDVFGTLSFAAKQVVGSSALVDIALAAVKSVSMIKAPLMGFPPFHNDPKQLLTNLDLSGNRKLFFLQGVGDLVVPTFNHYVCLNATMESVTRNGYSRENVESFLADIHYPFEVKDRKRDYCNNHIAFMFNRLNEFVDMLGGFFTRNL